MAEEVKKYKALKTLRKFHLSGARHRCIVGPVGSGKTAGASLECCYYIPMFLAQKLGVKRSKFAVVRNTAREMQKTTQKTILEWFPHGQMRVQAQEYFIYYEGGIEVELDFYGCDNPKQLKDLKSLELTGYWIDESIEVPDDIKRMLKNRIGRYPPANEWPVLKDQKGNAILDEDGEEMHDVRKFGIETTNPPDVDHPLYSMYAWIKPPPGPIPSGKPLPGHVGFWQPPYENKRNLGANYYEDLKEEYRDHPDWADMYVEGKPGVIIQGKLVYHNFKRDVHVAEKPLIWAEGPLYRGWDNSGNVPACVVLQVPRAGHIQILKEFFNDKQNIVDFTKDVVLQCNALWPGASYTDWDDPAGHNKYSTKEGGFTSNAELMSEAAGVETQASDQNLSARINAVDGQLGRIDGLLIDPGCTRLINGFLGGYCYPRISGTADRYSDNILKNRFSHLHDSLQYVCVKLVQSNAYANNIFIPKRTLTKTYNVRRPSF